eukprot:3315022-Rhodomonas_salina.2
MVRVHSPNCLNVLTTMTWPWPELEYSVMAAEGHVRARAVDHSQIPAHDLLLRKAERIQPTLRCMHNGKWCDFIDCQHGLARNAFHFSDLKVDRRRGPRAHNEGIVQAFVHAHTERLCCQQMQSLKLIARKEVESGMTDG